MCIIQTTQSYRINNEQRKRPSRSLTSCDLILEIGHKTIWPGMNFELIEVPVFLYKVITYIFGEAASNKNNSP